MAAAWDREPASYSQVLQASRSLRLHAFKGAHHEVSKIIKEGIAKVDLPDEITGDTCLHVAARVGHFKTVAVLSGSAFMNAQNALGDTALHLATLGGRANIAGLLLDHGADTSIRNFDGKRAIDLADSMNLLRVLDDSLSSAMRDMGTNRADEKGVTPLHKAVAAGKLNTVKRLVYQNVDVNCTDNEGNTPLHEACRGGNRNVKFVCLLIEKNAYINAQNVAGETPLHVAAAAGADALVSVFLEYAADATLLDVHGRTAFDVARSKRTARMLEGRPHAKPHKQVGDYILGRTLGAGSFGKVKMCASLTTGQELAVKILPKSALNTKEALDRMEREVAILKILKHPNVIQLVDNFESESNMYLVMEMARGRELFDFIIEHDTIPIEVTKCIFRQLVNGVEFCHRLNIVHRDLKPENIMVDSDLTLKIIDFGLSNLTPTLVYQTTCGSPHYVAPEVMQGLNYGPEVDIWSMGVILYAIVFGQLPFDEDEETNIVKSIIDLDSSLVFPPDASEEVVSLLRMMLVKDPDRRATFAEIRCHPWVNLPPMEPIVPMEQLQRMKLEPNALKTMETLGFEVEDVKESVGLGLDNAVSRIYCILVNRQPIRSGIERMETMIVGGQDPITHRRREERRLRLKFVDEAAMAGERSRAAAMLDDAKPKKGGGLSLLKKLKAKDRDGVKKKGAEVANGGEDGESSDLSLTGPEGGEAPDEVISLAEALDFLDLHKEKLQKRGDSEVDARVARDRARAKARERDKGKEVDSLTFLGGGRPTPAVKMTSDDAHPSSSRAPVTKGDLSVSVSDVSMASSASSQSVGTPQGSPGTVMSSSLPIAPPHAALLGISGVPARSAKVIRIKARRPDATAVGAASGNSPSSAPATSVVAPAGASPAQGPLNVTPAVQRAGSPTTISPGSSPAAGTGHQSLAERYAAERKAKLAKSNKKPLWPAGRQYSAPDKTRVRSSADRAGETAPERARSRSHGDRTGDVPERARSRSSPDRADGSPSVISQQISRSSAKAQAAHQAPLSPAQVRRDHPSVYISSARPRAPDRDEAVYPLFASGGSADGSGEGKWTGRGEPWPGSPPVHGWSISSFEPPPSNLGVFSSSSGKNSKSRDQPAASPRRSSSPPRTRTAYDGGHVLSTTEEEEEPDDAEDVDEMSLAQVLEMAGVSRPVERVGSKTRLRSADDLCFAPGGKNLS